MRVFLALLVDAYRELNHSKLFWITLLLSGTVVFAYGSIGFNEHGIFMFFGLWSIENDLFAKGSPLASMLYRSIFSSMMVSVWLAWIATILALISTSSIFPSFVSSGAIDLVLAKPITRARLFCLKYLCSLLFVVLQVSIFCVGVFVCMGLRIGEWEWRIFAAIPLVTSFYSYLYSFNVLVGVWTRSTLAALLLTLLFWFSLFSLSQAEGIAILFRETATLQLEDFDRQIGSLEAIEELSGPESDAAAAQARSNAHARLEAIRADRERSQSLHDRMESFYRVVYPIKAPFPKTSETIALLDRWLIRDTDVNMMDLLSGNVILTEDGEIIANRRTNDEKITARVEAVYEARPMWFLIGSSLAFEAAILFLGGLIFVRRDY